MKTAFLLTAGVGSRLRPHTNTKPKPSLPFAGLPLMNYSLYLALASQYQNFLFNQHHLPDVLDNTINDIKPFCASIKKMDETQNLLGSGGAIWNAKDELKNLDSFLIANGDEILIPQKDNILSELQNKFNESKALCTLLLCEHPDLLKTLKAVWVDEKGHVQGFGMKPPRDGLTPLHYTGYKIFSTRIFDYLPEGESNIFYDVLVSAIAKGDVVSSLKVTCDWYETGDFDSFVIATKSVLANNPEYLHKIHKFFNKTDFEILKNNENYLLKPKNLTLPKDLSWSGVVVLSKDMKLGQNIRLHNCFCEESSVLPSNSQIENQFLFAH